jgi:hypothetical protein
MFSVNVIGLRFRASHGHQPTFCAMWDEDFDLVQVYLCGRFLGFAHSFEQAADMVADMLYDLLDFQTIP